MVIFWSFLAQYKTKLIELDTRLTTARRKIQLDHIQLLILKIEHPIELSVKYSKESTKTLCLLKIGNKELEWEEHGRPKIN
jgi:hypothetical protein